MSKDYDAIVVGAGPNGLAAAIELAKRGKRVCIYEANDTIGGGARSAALTLPGFVHDVCSAVHPLAVAPPVFSPLPFARHGLQWRLPASASSPYARPAVWRRVDSKVPVRAPCSRGWPHTPCSHSNSCLRRRL